MNLEGEAQPSIEKNAASISWSYLLYHLPIAEVSPWASERYTKSVFTRQEIQVLAGNKSVPADTEGCVFH